MMPCRRTFAWALVALATLGPVSPGTASEAVRLAVVLDTSGSIEPQEFEKTRALCAALLEELPAGSEAALLTFDDQERLLLPWTRSAQELRQALQIVHPTGRRTALYDAVFAASRQLREAPAGRKALVLLTDGKDTGSTLTLEDGVRMAQDGRFPVFAVGIGDVQDRILKRIAKLTDGEYVPLASAESAVLAAAIEKAPPAPGPVAAAPAPAPAPVPAAPQGTVEADRPGSVGGRLPALAGNPWIWLGGALSLAFLAALVGVALLRRRSRPHCPSCGFELPGPLAACTFCSAETNAQIAKGAATPRPISRESVQPRPDAFRPPGEGGDASVLSETVLARYNVTEEYLEKTVSLEERPVLVVTAGPGAGRVFPLNDMSATSVGRAKANDIVLEDLSVSSEHCRIRSEEGSFIVHDLKSTNGTFVNEKKVSRHPLAAGDVLKVGETILQFRLDFRRAN